MSTERPDLIIPAKTIESDPKGAVYLRPGLFAELPERLLETAGLGGRITVISDETTFVLHGKKLMPELRKAGLETGDAIIVKPGENSKSEESYSEIMRQLSERAHSKKTPIVALGGGVVGDLAGYVAATFKRGVPFYQIPTTLLAQVDSGIGGKTGIDTDYGKNIVGAMYFPNSTFIDPELLSTLDAYQIRSGIGEIIKYAAMDREIFELVQQDLMAQIPDNTDFTTKIIEKCVSLKMKLVRLDPEDQRERQALNFGHTIGHGIEQTSKQGSIYSLSHGEAISIGMVAEAKLGVRRGYWEDKELAELISMLKRNHLPTALPPNIDINKAIDFMRNDKKNTTDDIRIVIPSKLCDPIHIPMLASDVDIKSLF